MSFKFQSQVFQPNPQLIQYIILDENQEEMVTDENTNYNQNSETFNSVKQYNDEILFINPLQLQNKSTQVEDGDLFDFNLEVKPILEVLVGKIIIQSRTELIEEFEIQQLKIKRDQFNSKRQAQLLIVQQLQQAYLRKQQEINLRNYQIEINKNQNKAYHKKLLSRTISKQIIQFAKFDALESVYENPLINFQLHIGPWLIQQTQKEYAKKMEIKQFVQDQILLKQSQLQIQTQININKRNIAIYKQNQEKKNQLKQIEIQKQQKRLLKIKKEIFLKRQQQFIEIQNEIQFVDINEFDQIEVIGFFEQSQQDCLRLLGGISGELTLMIQTLNTFEIYLEDEQLKEFILNVQKLNIRFNKQEIIPQNEQVQRILMEIKESKEDQQQFKNVLRISQIDQPVIELELDQFDGKVLQINRQNYQVQQLIQCKSQDSQLLIIDHRLQHQFRLKLFQILNQTFEIEELIIQQIQQMYQELEDQILQKLSVAIFDLFLKNDQIRIRLISKPIKKQAQKSNKKSKQQQIQDKSQQGFYGALTLESGKPSQEDQKRQKLLDYQKELQQQIDYQKQEKQKQKNLQLQQDAEFEERQKKEIEEYNQQQLKLKQQQQAVYTQNQNNILRIDNQVIKSKDLQRTQNNFNKPDQDKNEFIEEQKYQQDDELEELIKQTQNIQQQQQQQQQTQQQTQQQDLLNLNNRIQFNNNSAIGYQKKQHFQRLNEIQNMIQQSYQNFTNIKIDKFNIDKIDKFNIDQNPIYRFKQNSFHDNRNKQKQMLQIETQFIQNDYNISKLIQNDYKQSNKQNYNQQNQAQNYNQNYSQQNQNYSQQNQNYNQNQNQNQHYNQQNYNQQNYSQNYNNSNLDQYNDIIDQIQVLLQNQYKVEKFKPDQNSNLNSNIKNYYNDQNKQINEYYNQNLSQVISNKSMNSNRKPLKHHSSYIMVNQDQIENQNNDNIDFNLDNTTVIINGKQVNIKDQNNLGNISEKNDESNHNSQKKQKESEEQDNNDNQSDIQFKDMLDKKNHDQAVSLDDNLEFIESIENLKNEIKDKDQEKQTKKDKNQIDNDIEESIQDYIEQENIEKQENQTKNEIYNDKDINESIQDDIKEELDEKQDNNIDKNKKQENTKQE